MALKDLEQLHVSLSFSHKQLEHYLEKLRTELKTFKKKVKTDMQKETISDLLAICENLADEVHLAGLVTEVELMLDEHYLDGITFKGLKSRKQCIFRFNE